MELNHGGWLKSSQLSMAITGFAWMIHTSFASLRSIGIALLKIGVFGWDMVYRERQISCKTILANGLALSRVQETNTMKVEFRDYKKNPLTPAEIERTAKEGQAWAKKQILKMVKWDERSKKVPLDAKIRY